MDITGLCIPYSSLLTGLSCEVPHGLLSGRVKLSETGEDLPNSQSRGPEYLGQVPQTLTQLSCHQRLMSDGVMEVICFCSHMQ